MSNYADKSPKEIAAKIQDLWGLVNRNAQAQYKAKKAGNMTELEILMNDEHSLHMRISHIALELAKKVNS